MASTSAWRAAPKRRCNYFKYPAELALVDLESPEGPELLRRLKEHPPAAITLVHRAHRGGRHGGQTARV